MNESNRETFLPWHLLRCTFKIRHRYRLQRDIFISIIEWNGKTKWDTALTCIQAVEGERNNKKDTDTPMME